MNDFFLGVNDTSTAQPETPKATILALAVAVIKITIKEQREQPNAGRKLAFIFQAEVESLVMEGMIKP